MTILASDSMTYTNGLLDSAHTAGAWSITTNLDVYNIASNIAVAGALANDSGAYYSGITWPNNQYAKCTLVATHADGAGVGYGVMVRLDTAGSNYYRLVGNASGFELVKKVAGTTTSLASGTGTTFTAGDTIALQVSGTTLTTYKNGVQFGSPITDAAVATGNAGLGYSSTSSASDGVINFEGGDTMSSAGPLNQGRSIYVLP